MSEPLLMFFEKLPEDDRNRIMKAVDALCKNNADVVRELEKLADIKTNNPMQWKMGKKILKM
jgi:hypothetical protein